MNSELRNPEYYRWAFLEIKKFMEVGEEGKEVHEETVLNLLHLQTQDFGLLSWAKN